MNFSFKLKGNQFLSIYLSCLFFYVFPIFYEQFFLRNMKNGKTDILSATIHLLVVLFVVIFLFAITTPFLKRVINSIYLGDNALLYNGNTGEFIKLCLINMLFSLLTIGFYFPWFISKITKYILKNIEYKDSRFKFLGKTLHLFLLFVFTFLLPMSLWALLIFIIKKYVVITFIISITAQLLLFICYIPYIYYYKWSINIQYKEYTIRWDTISFHSILVIIREFCLTLVTIGIYLPIAAAKLYEYFVNRTIVQNNDRIVLKINTKLEYFKIWKKTWVQIFLTVITFGIYGAWAWCNVLRLFLNNTSVQKV